MSANLLTKSDNMKNYTHYFSKRLHYDVFQKGKVLKLVFQKNCSFPTIFSSIVNIYLLRKESFITICPTVIAAFLKGRTAKDGLRQKCIRHIIENKHITSSIVKGYLSDAER